LAWVLLLVIKLNKNSTKLKLSIGNNIKWDS
jgi:hypothetical protein